MIKITMKRDMSHLPNLRILFKCYLEEIAYSQQTDFESVLILFHSIQESKTATPFAEKLGELAQVVLFLDFY